MKGYPEANEARESFPASIHEPHTSPLHNLQPRVSTTCEQVTGMRDENLSHSRAIIEELLKGHKHAHKSTGIVDFLETWKRRKISSLDSKTGPGRGWSKEADLKNRTSLAKSASFPWTFCSIPLTL